MTPEQLEAIEGIGPKTVEKISLAVNNYFASLESGVVEGEVPAEGAITEGEPGSEVVPEEAALEAASDEVAAEGEQAAAPEAADAEAAAEEKHEQGPKDGSAPETTE
jgi:N utilization substance protein A